METLTASLRPDALSDILQSVRFKSTILCRSYLTAPWGFRVAGKDDSSFHIVVQGKCWLDLDGRGESIPLSNGDLVILPHGHQHILRDSPGSPALLLDELLTKNPFDPNRDLRYGGSGVLTLLVCGSFRFENRSANPLLPSLPPLIHIRSENGQAASWLQLTLQSLMNEVLSSQPGAETVVTRLSDILFIQALRAHFTGPAGESQGWVSALKDQQVSTSLSLIHRWPEKPWTVTALAREVGMSRTAFSMRFSLLVGESPLRYLTRCRIDRAISFLRSSNATIPQIAEQVGYQSEVAFSRAFKRHVGVPPGAYRRAVHREPAGE